MFRGDLARDGHLTNARSLTQDKVGRLGLLWSSRTDGAVDGTPVVARGMVIVGSAAGTLTALDATTGRPAWSVRGLGAISSSPAVFGDHVITSSLTGNVYAFGIAKGDVVWKWTGPANAALWASPAIYKDVLIIGVGSPYGDTPFVPGRVYGLNVGTGHELWSFCVQSSCEPGGGVWSTPAIDPAGTAFVGVGNPVDGVLAFDALTGTRKWTSSLYPDQNRDFDAGASPVIFALDGREAVAQATVEGTFAVLDATTGKVLWSRELVAGSAVHGLIASPAYDGKSFFVGSASPPTGMFALEPTHGATRWRRDSPQPVYSAPVTGSGVVIFGTGAVFGDLSSGSILALSSGDGHVIWSYDTHSAVRSGPALAGALLVVGDYAGDVMAFRPKP